MGNGKRGETGDDPKEKEERERKRGIVEMETWRMEERIERFCRKRNGKSGKQGQALTEPTPFLSSHSSIFLLLFLGKILISTLIFRGLNFSITFYFEIIIRKSYNYFFWINLNSQLEFFLRIFTIIVHFAKLH